MELTTHFHLVLSLSLELHFDSSTALHDMALNYVMKYVDKFTITSKGIHENNMESIIRQMCQDSLKKSRFLQLHATCDFDYHRLPYRKVAYALGRIRKENRVFMMKPTRHKLWQLFIIQFRNCCVPT